MCQAATNLKNTVQFRTIRADQAGFKVWDLHGSGMYFCIQNQQQKAASGADMERTEGYVLRQEVQYSKKIISANLDSHLGLDTTIITSPELSVPFEEVVLHEFPRSLPT